MIGPKKWFEPITFLRGLFRQFYVRQASIARGIRHGCGIFSQYNPLTLTVRRQAITPVLDGTRSTFDRIDWRAKLRAFEKSLSCEFAVILEFSSHLFLRGNELTRP